MTTLNRATQSILIACVIAATSGAAELDRDTEAVNAIFGSQRPHNLLPLYQRLGDLNDEERFDALFDAVFPPGRRTVRIQFEFRPTPFGSRRSRASGLVDEESKHTLPTAYRQGQLLAPAIDLMRIAESLNRLGHIERMVQNVSLSSTEESKAALAIRMLLAMQRGNLNSVDQLMSQFIPLIPTGKAEERELGAETIIIWDAARRPETHEFALQLIFPFFEAARTGTPVGSERWRRHLYALNYLLQAAAGDQEIDWDRSIKRPGDRSARSEPDAMSNWIPVSRTTSESDGDGFPLAQWLMKPLSPVHGQRTVESGQVASVGGHDRDYLLYAIPMEGDVRVEAELSPFDYRDIRLGFGGIWAGPGYDHQSLLVGRFGGDEPMQPIDPRLDQIERSIRAEIAVHDGVRSTWINGRPVFQSEVSSSDPWLTVFSYWYTHGWVQNLRITGRPTVPHAIDLLSGGRLLGWNSFYGPGIGDEGCGWDRLHVKTNKPGPSQYVVLRGKRHIEMRYGFDERLVQYQRPIVETARVTYEYFYEPDRFDVHPAIGRTALLIRPEGVIRHRVTNGIHERMGRRPYPDGLGAQVTGRRPILPLRANDWNRVELVVSGRECVLRVNGRVVFRGEVEPSGQQLFGFFHYADQSESRVRNVIWHGDWPLELPSEFDQQLSDDSVERMLAGPELQAVFHHDFSEGIPSDRFLLSGKGRKEAAQTPTEGIRLSLTGEDRFVQSIIWPQLQMQGDFDAVARFEQFGGTVAEGGDINVQLHVGFDEGEKDFRLYRKFTRFEKKEIGQQVVQAAYFHSREGHRTYEFPHLSSEAARGGRLRFSRRGDTIYYLFAANDSNWFRLLHRETVPIGSTKSGGLSLVLESTKPGNASVVWKTLDVRAEGISGLATESMMNIARLDETRDALPDRLVLDLAMKASSRGVTTWGNSAQFEFSDEGLLLTGPGFDQWEGHGFFPHVAMSGDFDVAVELEAKQMLRPADGGETVLYLETDFNDPRRTAVQIKFALARDGSRGGEVQLNRLGDDGEMKYTEVVNRAVEGVHRLRIARREGVAYFVIQEEPGSTPVLLGRIEVGDRPVSMSHVRVMAHTAGAGRQIKALYKKMFFHASRITRQ